MLPQLSQVYSDPVRGVELRPSCAASGVALAGRSLTGGCRRGCVQGSQGGGHSSVSARRTVRRLGRVLNKRMPEVTANIKGSGAWGEDQEKERRKHLPRGGTARPSVRRTDFLFKAGRCFHTDPCAVGGSLLRTQSGGRPATRGPGECQHLRLYVSPGI